MYDPCTLAFSFPPYPRGGIALGDKLKPWSVGRAFYGLKPWIGVDIWHVDPEKRSEFNRTDDSCGWFDRGPGEYADAVAYVLKDKNTMHEIGRSLNTRADTLHAYGGVFPAMPPSEALAVCLLVTRELEVRRWWNGQNGNGGAHASWLKRMFTKRRSVEDTAINLALNPLDNLQTVEEAESMVRLIAAALNRHYRPWWKHPRWHVHHWRLNFDLPRNLKRMFQRCAACGKRLGFGHCPVRDGGKLYHGHGCDKSPYGIAAANGPR